MLHIVVENRIDSTKNDQHLRNTGMTFAKAMLFAVKFKAYFSIDKNLKNSRFVIKLNRDKIEIEQKISTEALLSFYELVMNVQFSKNKAKNKNNGFV